MSDPNEITVEHKSAQAALHQPKTEAVTVTDERARIKTEEDEKRRTAVLAIIRKLS